MHQKHIARFEQLTGLRFLAAAGVAICHFSMLLGIPEGLRFLTDFFGSFVALFFVLSGFVLAHTYAESFQQPDFKATYRAFLVARFARVAPMYWLSLLAILALFYWSGFHLSLGGTAEYGHKLDSFVLNFFALQAWIPDVEVQQYWNAPGWSISSEVFFYAAFPLVLRLPLLDGSRRSFFILWLGMALMLAVIYALATLYLDESPQKTVWLAYVIRCPLLGFFCFSLGVHLQRAAVGRDDGSVRTTPTVLLCLAAFVLMISHQAYAFKASAKDGFYAGIVAIYLIYTPFFYCLILALLRSDNKMTRTLSRPAMVELGNASYALYLIHWTALCVAISTPHLFLEKPWMSWLLLVLLVLLSVVLYRRFESPFRSSICMRLSRKMPHAA
jgi:peptidoglycan/LPS O-acetylase OafA/YrhL